MDTNFRPRTVDSDLRTRLEDLRGAVLSCLLTVPTGPPRRCGVHADNAALLPGEEQEGSQVPPAPRPGG